MSAALNRVLLLLTPAMTLTVASEFIVIGLLPRISSDMHIPLALAGQLTAVFAATAALLGPIVTLMVSRMPAAAVLVGVLVLFAIGNTVMAVTSLFPLMLAARAVQGAFLPAFISVGTAMVTRLTWRAERGRALARANLGFVLGILLALPAGIALSQGGNWRMPFAFLAAAAVPVVACVAIFFPRSRRRGMRVANQIAILGRPRFLGHLLLSVSIFAAMFSGYTYLGAYFEEMLGLGANGVALALFVFGAIGLAGNVLADRVADGYPMRATAVMLIVLALAINAAAVLGHSTFTAAVPLALWALTHTASVTLSQVRVTLAGGEAPAFAMTMNISAANLGIALGASVGGWVVNQRGLTAIGAAPGVLVVISLLIVGGLAVPMLDGRRENSRRSGIYGSHVVQPASASGCKA